MINKFTKSAVSMLILASTTFAAHAAVNFDTIKDAAPVDIAFSEPAQITHTLTRTNNEFPIGLITSKITLANGEIDMIGGATEKIAFSFDPSMDPAVSAPNLGKMKGKYDNTNVYDINIMSDFANAPESGVDKGWYVTTNKVSKWTYTIALNKDSNMKPDEYVVKTRAAVYND